MPKPLPIEQILEGNPYGNLTVLRYGPTKKTPGGQSKRTLVCSCSCGRLLEGDAAPFSDNVRRGNTTQCLECGDKKRSASLADDFSGMSIAGCKVLRKCHHVRSKEKIRWTLLCFSCRDEYEITADNLRTAIKTEQDDPDYRMKCRACLNATALRPDLSPEKVALALSLRKAWENTLPEQRTITRELVEIWKGLVMPVHNNKRTAATSPDQLAGIELWLDSDAFNQEKMLHRLITMLHPDYKGKTAEAERFFGCTISHAIRHIEKQFEPWMNWRNRGNSPGCWNVDHIFPKSRTSRVSNSIETLACSNWKNLRPLSYEDNMKKGDRIVHGAQELFGLLCKEQETGIAFTFTDFAEFLKTL